MEENEDKVLVQKLQQGNIDAKDALSRIYMKYHKFLLGLAINFSNGQKSTKDAEDAVHDAFISFAATIVNLTLRDSLKYYLAACVINKIREIKRPPRRSGRQLNELSSTNLRTNDPVQFAILTEESKRITAALDQLPHEQREVVLLRIHAEMTAKEISQIQGVSVNTIKSQYRYALQKLRSRLDRKMLE